MTDPRAAQPLTATGREWLATVSAAVLDPALATYLSDSGVPQLVALVHVDALRDAILAIEAEAAERARTPEAGLREAARAVLNHHEDTAYEVHEYGDGCFERLRALATEDQQGGE